MRLRRMIPVCLVLALLLSCVFAGCSQEKSPEDTTIAPEQTTAPTAEPTTAPTTEPTAAPTTEPSTEPSTEPATEPGHTHLYNEGTVDATCTQGGYTLYQCECGESYTGNETKPLGHNYSSQLVAPTDKEQGYTLYTCTACGLSYKDNYTWDAPDAATAFFDDAAFIGDSVTLALRNYNTANKVFGNATFLCQGSYSVNNAVTNQMYLSYQGQEMTPQDALAACGAKKVFILLGMNDIALFGQESIGIAMENWATLISSIREKNPDIAIYIQSGTPIYTNGQKGGLNNERMDAYNEKLKEFAAANGCNYVDIATPMKDSTNGLAEKYCSDAYVHLTQAACELWTSILKDYVA